MGARLIRYCCGKQCDLLKKNVDPHLILDNSNTVLNIYFKLLLNIKYVFKYELRVP